MNSFSSFYIKPDDSDYSLKSLAKAEETLDAFLALMPEEQLEAAQAQVIPLSERSEVPTAEIGSEEAPNLADGSGPAEVGRLPQPETGGKSVGLGVGAGAGAGDGVSSSPQISWAADVDATGLPQS